MLESLRQFVLIVEHGTFTRAARRAHLSQPALTASIHRLEDELGARLLTRGRQGAALTAAGEALLPRARAALAALEDARRAVREVAGLHAGEVRLGAGATACTYLLPRGLAEFRAQHPDVRFLLREATTAEVMSALQAGELDLGVITPAHGAPFTLPTDPWFMDELVLVSSAAATVLPGAAGRARLARLPFLTFGKGSTTRELLDRHFPGAEVVMELGSIAAVKGNVRAGIGVALVSRSAVFADLAARRLVELPHPATPIRRPLHLVHRGLDRLPPAAAALRAMLLASPPERPPGVASRRQRSASKRSKKPR
jgi:DNA-binding transcriptional LysR family regulator